MTVQRQRLHFMLATAAAAVGLASAPAMAQGSYPSKTVLMIVPAAAGGTTDLAGRMAAQALAPVIGQSVVVDNKGGGNGAIAANLVKRADADGYTLLMQYSGYHVISPHLTKARSWEQATLPPWPMCCRRRRSSWCAPSCR
jgi:tripartite-type tricarboxylate transporter receptor subunit TctC